MYCTSTNYFGFGSLFPKQCSIPIVRDLSVLMFGYSSRSQIQPNTLWMWRDGSVGLDCGFWLLLLMMS